MFHYVACGLPNVWLENGYRETEMSDGSAGFSIDNVKDLHQQIGRSLAKKESLLNGDEFRFLRSELRMSRRNMGEFLGLSDETIKKWESGENPVHKASDAAIRSLFLESLLEASKIKDLLQLINHIEKTQQELRFKETAIGWREDRQCA